MATRFWVRGTGNWNSSDTSHWAEVSGGAPGKTVPTTADAVIFDGNSGSGTVTCTSGGQAICASLTASSSSVGSTGTIVVYGNVSLNTTFCSGEPNFFINGTCSFNSGGGTIGNLIGAWETTCAITLAANLTTSITSYIRIGDGSTCSFNANGFNVTTGNYYALSAVSTTSLGTGTWSIKNASTIWVGAGGQWHVHSSSTVNASTSTIKMDNNGSGQTMTFVGGGKTYNNLWLSNGINNTLSITGANTFADLKVDREAGLTLPSGVTTTVSTFTVNGLSLAEKVTVRASSNGSQATLSKSSGTVNCVYLDLKDSAATGGATWNALDSINSGNNSGWNIVPPVSAFFSHTIPFA